jgi:hypothetical protein
MLIWKSASWSTSVSIAPQLSMEIEFGDGIAGCLSLIYPSESESPSMRETSLEIRLLVSLSGVCEVHHQSFFSCRWSQSRQHLISGGTGCYILLGDSRAVVPFTRGALRVSSHLHSARGMWGGALGVGRSMYCGEYPTGLFRRLAEGGFATVYSMRDTHLSFPVLFSSVFVCREGWTKGEILLLFFPRAGDCSSMCL